MYVLELLQPGAFLDGIEDDEKHREVLFLLELLTGCVDDAAIALNQFVEYGEMLQRRYESGAEVAEHLRPKELRTQLRSEMEVPLEFRYGDEVELELSRRVRTILISEGVKPASYHWRTIFGHAKSYVYALDTFQNALRILARMEVAPDGVRVAQTAFEQEFQDLVHVRNTAHHAEDRIRGLDRRKRPIRLQPFNFPGDSNSDGGAIVMGHLLGDRYIVTIEDGSCGEVEVSLRTASVLTSVAQQVLDSFQWRGPATLLPM